MDFVQNDPKVDRGLPSVTDVTHPHREIERRRSRNVGMTDLRVSYGQSEVIHGAEPRAEPKKILAVMGPQRHGQDDVVSAR